MSLFSGRQGMRQKAPQTIMRSRQFYSIVLALGSGILLASAAAPEPTLKVGDPAPKLQTGKWVQGDPVKALETGKAYLVEFWATWCGPCRVSIPHLNEIHNKYKDKDLVVIGQDCWERDEKLVEPFISKMGDKMTYRVALDDKKEEEQGKMAQTWMAAAGRGGIPSAFLVDKKGTIAWIGHPMSLSDSLIDEVLAGSFDVSKAAAEYKEQQQTEAKMRPLQQSIMRAMAQKDWDGAMTKIEEAEKLLPPDKRSNLDMMRLNVLLGKKDYTQAYPLMEKMSEANKNSGSFLNQLAWRIATDKSIEQRDLALAEKIANRANEASKGKDPATLDTLARIKFMRGDKEQALSLQQKAVDLADANMQPGLQKVLESYKQDKLPSED